MAEVLEAGLQVEHGADPGKSFTGGGVEKLYWDLCKAQHKKTLTLEGTNTRGQNHIPRQTAKNLLAAGKQKIRVLKQVLIAQTPCRCV